MYLEVENRGFNIHNSFGVQAVADRLIEFDSEQSLANTLRSDPSVLASKWIVVGAGNNTLFTDRFDGTVIHPVSRGITVTADRGESVDVRVEAGELWDDFVEWCVVHELWGVENLSAVPSSVGAVPVQNIGAYGAEAKDSILSVEMLCTESVSHLTLSADHCDFGYRSSVFKGVLKGKVVVTAVNFRLSRTPAPKLDYGALRARVEELGGATLRNTRNAVIAIRAAKLPDPNVTGNAGSFFCNPVVDSDVAERMLLSWPDMPVYPSQQQGRVKLAAGWLIDKAGWRGARCGRVGVHAAQALVLVNLGGATGREVVDLANRIADDVEHKFAVRISPEVVIV